MKNTRKLIFLSLLVVIGLGLGLVESMMLLTLCSPMSQIRTFKYGHTNNLGCF